MRIWTQSCIYTQNYQKHTTVEIKLMNFYNRQLNSNLRVSDTFWKTEELTAEIIAALESTTKETLATIK
jgi:phosphorylcholine metabolism protein LicD